MNSLVLSLVLAFSVGTMMPAQGFAENSDPEIEEQPPKSKNVQSGFVFWDGQYLPLPYTLTEGGNCIYLNGRLLGPFQHSEQQSLGTIADQLERGDALVVLPGPSPRFVSAVTASMIFENVLASPGEPVTIGSRDGWNPVGVSLDEWNQHFQHMEITAEFRDRAQSLIDWVNDVRSQADWCLWKQAMFAKCGYLLTVGAIVLVTLAVGQLLGSHRLLVSPEADSVDPKVIDGAFTGNLRLIVALAALDLVWTIGAASAGEMTEMNPIGRQLIQSPWALTLMKSASTLIAVAIFHSCRLHPLVRKANWWACTVYMLVGMRWIFLSGAMI